MENLAQGLVISIIGIFIVSLSLWLISLILGLLQFVAVKETPKAIDISQPEIVAELEESDEENDLELVAVITAAISAAMQIAPEGLIVRSIKRVSK